MWFKINEKAEITFSYGSINDTSKSNECTNAMPFGKKVSTKFLEIHKKKKLLKTVGDQIMVRFQLMVYLNFCLNKIIIYKKIRTIGL
jgi:hypothetical protein